MTSDALEPRELGTEIEIPGYPVRSTREHEIRVAPTKSISLVGHNLAVSWKTGLSWNLNSRLSRAQRIDSEPNRNHRQGANKHHENLSDRRQHTSRPVF